MSSWVLFFIPNAELQDRGVTVKVNPSSERGRRAHTDVYRREPRRKEAGVTELQTRGPDPGLGTRESFIREEGKGLSQEQVERRARPVEGPA